VEDYSSILEDSVPEIPQPPPLQCLLWKDDYRNILSSPIWNLPRLHTSTDGLERPRNNTDVHPEMVPHEAIIWAKDRQELRNLKRLSGYVVIGGTLSGSQNGVPYTRPYHDLCGIRAEFSPEYNAERRVIGIQKERDGSDWFEENCVHFDIDGQGGEQIIGISVAMHEAPKTIKVKLLSSLR